MSLRTDLARLRAAPPETARLMVEAGAALVAARLAVALLPFRTTARWFGLTAAAFDEDVGSGETGDEPVPLAWAVAAMARRLPLHSTCLVRALAAACLLRRRNRPAMLVLGVAQTRGLAAHAWLVSDGVILTGGAERDGYRQIAAFCLAAR